jgi:hypothetical protein
MRHTDSMELLGMQHCLIMALERLILAPAIKIER